MYGTYQHTIIQVKLFFAAHNILIKVLSIALKCIQYHCCRMIDNGITDSFQGKPSLCSTDEGSVNEHFGSGLKIQRHSRGQNRIKHGGLVLKPRREHKRGHATACITIISLLQGKLTLNMHCSSVAHAHTAGLSRIIFPAALFCHTLQGNLYI